MKTTLLLAACLVPGMAAFVASQAQDKPAAGPPRLGVVDLSKCFDKTRYEEIKDIDEELQKMAEGIARKLREADGGDPKELQKLRERLKGEYLVFYNRKKAEIYNEIRAIVDIIGRERGHTLVLRKESPRLEGDENESVGALIGQRVVLFHDPAIDITDEVLKRLNAAYAAKKGKKEKDF